MSTNPPEPELPEQLPGANEPAAAPTPMESETVGSTEMVATAEVQAASAHLAEPMLSEEFREFGRQVAALLRVVRESPRAREIEGQMTQTMRDLERQVNEAMNTARERTQAQDWKGTIKGAATTAADETQRGLARGLRKLNEQMARTVQEAEKNKPPASGPGPSGPGSEGGPTESQ